jgi:hypothetical protein
MTTIEMPLSSLHLDRGTQVRVAIHDQVVAHYAERMTAGVVFPAIVVFTDGTGYYLADGFHRYLAAQRSGRPTLTADVHPGSRTDALWFALGANKANGCHMTEHDKQHAVALALQAWPEKMQREIAAQVGCSASLVSKVAAASTTGGEPVLRGRALAAKRKRDAIRALVVAGAQSIDIRRQLHAHSELIADVRRELGLSTIDYSRRAINQRRATMRRMATEGYRSSQIASALGITEETCRLTLRREGIDVPADTVTRGTRHHDSNRIVASIVEDANNLLAGANLVDFTNLDRAQIGDWVRSLLRSRATLTTFIRRLSQEQSHGEAA